MYREIIFITVLLNNFLVFISAIAQNNELDVRNYHVEISADILKEKIEGNVIIDFSINPAYDKVIFNCGNLKVTKIKGKAVRNFQQKDEELTIFLKDVKDNNNQIQIYYNGSPSKGLIFTSGPAQVYTVYSTNEWMVCNASPDDRAAITLDLLVADSLSCIANGNLIQKKKKSKNFDMYSWRLEQASPAYTYGFAIGPFNEYSVKYNQTYLNYYSSNYTSKELEIIFDKTSDMLSFFEEKSGIPYFQTTYSQVLIGNHYQEMSGFAVLKKTYGELVLKDSTETNLISHELAHQWWGNMITCKSWNHFWLNEAFATYLSAAYNEHRFGKQKYLSDINSYFNVYQKIKNKGNDKPLVFKDWLNPSQDDRNLIYFKGAYVLHLLREELGDESFWKAVKLYSIKYYGKSVTTKDFQNSVEESTGKDQNVFFNKWIY